jgi:hypothetical protein
MGGATVAEQRMTRKLTAIIGAAIGVALAAGGVFAATSNDDGSDSDAGSRAPAARAASGGPPPPVGPTKRVAAAWTLLEVGPRRDVLLLAYKSGGCLVGNGRVRVREQRSRVRVWVTQDEAVGPDQLCHDVLGTPRLRARLHDPIGGRRIVGGPRFHSDLLYARVRDDNGDAVVLVPRVVGLNSQDAVALLRRQGFNARVAGLGAVVGQKPRPGQPAPDGAVDLIVRPESR